MKSKSFLILFLCLFAGKTALYAQDATSVTTEKKAFPYWYVGAGYSVPFMFADTYSLTEAKNHFGGRIDLKFGRRFSNIFGLELGLYHGRMKTTARDFSRKFVLATNGMTYYPYTLVDGTEYSEYPDLFGFWETNSANAHLTGTRYSDIYVKTNYTQLSLQGVFNLNRLFMNVPKDREQFFSVFLKPGFYLQRFSSRAFKTANDEAAAPRIKTPITVGLGGDLAMHFRLSHNWGLEINSSLVWASSQELDGIRTMKISHDDYIWSNGATLIYKFGRKHREVPQVPVVTPVVPLPELRLDYWYPVRPTTIAPKQRSHSAAIYLTYILNKTYITPDLHNNPQELKRLEHELNTYLNNPDYTVRSIRVEGFASPEGPYDNNMRLAEGRARSIIDYIVGRTDLGRGMFTVGRMTENWDGLRDTLQKNPELPGRDAVLALLARQPDTERVKTEIKRIPEYKYLLENVYPRLRLSSYTVEYEVKAYDALEARKVMETNPSALSAEEMYAVAVDYGINTEQGQKAIGILNRHYPQSDIALTYQGIRLLESGKHVEAASVLEKVADKNATVLNALAVAYAYQKDYERAQRILEEVSFSSGDARRNLQTLKRFVDVVNR